MGADLHGDRLDVLLALVEIYEAKGWPIDIDDSFDPIDVLNYAIEELGHTRAELAELLHSRPRASEILARRRPSALPRERFGPTGCTADL